MLAGVDADALEGVDMSREHMRLVTELLRSYGVVDADSDDDDDDDAVAAGLDALALAPTRLDAATPAFTPGAPPPPEPAAAPEPAPPPPPAEAPAEQAKPAERAKPAPSFAPGEPPKDREAAAIWAHLTRRLSFSEARAHQALGPALRRWQAASLERAGDLQLDLGPGGFGADTLAVGSTAGDVRQSRIIGLQRELLDREAQLGQAHHASLQWREERSSLLQDLSLIHI